MNLDKFTPYFELASTVLLYLVLALTPLLFVPVLADAFDLPKQTFFLITTLVAIICLLLPHLATKKITIARSVFDAPLYLLAATSLASAAFSTNRFTALAPDPVTFVSLTGLLFLLSQKINSEKSLLLTGKILIFTGGLLGLWSIVQTAYSFIPAAITIPQFLAPYLSPSFSPIGSTLSQAIYLSILFPMALGLVYQSFKKRVTDLTLLLPAALLTVGLVISVYFLYNNRPILLPVDSGWKIATGTLGQSLTTAFVGVGPAHFVDSFTLYKPIGFNSTPLWNLRFITSSNFYFHLLTVTGLLGLSAFIWLSLRIIKTAKKRLDTELATPLEKGLIASLAVSLLSFLVLPTPLTSLFAFVAILGLFVGHLRQSGNTKFVFQYDNSLSPSPFTAPIFFLAVLAVLVGATYFLGRLTLADWHFANSLKAAAQNQGTETYNEQIAALTFNPWNENYRVSYSQTNLALANALASSPNLSDEQKQTVLALVQQSIREGRNAVNLEPRRSIDWENLSLIYRNLINFAQGADQFAIASLNQAISFDPANPRLRLDLGGIYFSLKDFQSAAQAFAQAVSLKPDYANAHYNLAQALKELKLSDQAISQLQLTSTLVCTNKNSPDCQKVTAEITALGEKPASPSATTQTPAENPLSTPSAKSNLPKAATKPPATISSPSGEIAP